MKIIRLTIITEMHIKTIIKYLMAIRPTNNKVSLITSSLSKKRGKLERFHVSTLWGTKFGKCLTIPIKTKMYI